MIFLIKYKCLKKKVKLGLLLLLFHPFLNLGHAGIAKLDMTWAFWFGTVVWLKKWPLEPYI